jgi:hypothetical protein
MGQWYRAPDLHHGLILKMRRTPRVSYKAPGQYPCFRGGTVLPPPAVPLGDIISGLLRAGMRIDWLREHDAVAWHMFYLLVRSADGLWRWPDKPWLALAFSLRATRR